MRRVSLSYLTISFFLICCLFVSCNTLYKSQPASNNVAPYILLPEPQKIAYLQGACKLKSERFIFLDISSSDKLLGIGRIVQESLAQVGPRWELTAARGRQSQQIGVTITVDPIKIQRPQGYRLIIDANQISIIAHNAAGAFYAAQTLKQICRQRQGMQELACIDINDWPDFANRGVLLDISRDKVPTMKTLSELVDLLSE
jgi:N-acetyl-beta-hexosaminidase